MENLNQVNENNGTIKISDEVVATIASVAAGEVEGVSGLMGTLAGDIVSKFSKKNLTKGIKVSTNDNETVIDMNLIVKYGIKIPEIAWEVQERVKKAVESMSGLSVMKVNVHIGGVEFGSEEKDSQIQTDTEE